MGTPSPANSKTRPAASAPVWVGPQPRLALCLHLTAKIMSQMQWLQLLMMTPALAESDVEAPPHLRLRPARIR